jgi:hypothetical protein
MRSHPLNQGKTSSFKFYTGKYILCFLLALAIHPVIFAKEAFTWRQIFRPFHTPIYFSFSLGYGVNSDENTIAGMSMFVKDGKHYLVESGVSNTIYLVRWMGQPYVRLKTYDNIQEFLTNASPKAIVFKGRGTVLPITLSGHVDFLKKLRIEVGGSLLINQLKTLTPDKEHEFLGDYSDPLGKHYILRPFALIGFKVLENSAYTVLINTQVSFDFTYASLSDRIATYRSIFPPVGLGVTLEKHISEYASAFGKIMYDTKILAAPFVDKKGVLSKSQVLCLQLGFSVSCPEIPRCPIEHCEVEVKHKHGGKPYRGVSMFTGKDAKGYRLYEK